VAYSMLLTPCLKPLRYASAVLVHPHNLSESLKSRHRGQELALLDDSLVASTLLALRPL